MKCPDCSYLDSRVIESRDLEDGLSIRRRRQCLRCEFRFTTYERTEQRQLTIVKKDGTRQPFNREKLAAGLYRACEKRPIAVAKIESLIDGIEHDLRSQGEPELSVNLIGEMAMDRLITLDDVAYVRFASVYRSFADVASFERELSKLKSRAASE